MQPYGETTKFCLPNVGAPFATVQRICSAVGLVDRNRPHYHPDTIEFCSVVRGQLDWFVGEESFLVKAGDILVIPGQVVHGSVDANLQPCELIAIHVMPEQLPGALAEAALALEGRRIRDAEVAAFIGRVYDVHRCQSRFLEEVTRALAALLVAATVDLHDSEDERRDSRLIRQAQRAMAAKGGERPTMDDVADRLGVSSVWLHKVFVRETGASPGEWARARRMSDAKRMLEDSHLSTHAIAMRLGYATGQSFCTAFKRESGMTPSEYRALHTRPGSTGSKTIYCVDMRETWENGHRLYPPPDAN